MDNWATPKWVMNIFEEWFDPCPLNEDPEINGLEIEWKDKTYVNPPYSNPLPWVEKAIEENKKGKTIVMLLNVDTSTKWFSKLNEANAHFLWFSERLKFSEKDASPRPSMLVILEGFQNLEDYEHNNRRGERARTRQKSRDSISKGVTYYASESKSNKRDISNPDASSENHEEEKKNG